MAVFPKNQKKGYNHDLGCAEPLTLTFPDGLSTSRPRIGKQMLTGIQQSVAILLTGIVYYAVDAWLIRRFDPYRPGQGSGRSWGYTAFMVAFLTLLIAQPVLLPGLGLRVDAWWGLALQAAGMLLIAGSLALHWWARSHLRQFYVEDVQFQDGQSLVASGPYQYVRHPVFTSFFLVAIGLLLVNPALTTLLMLVYVCVDFPRAAHREEELLAEKLPDYTDYMERTGRFVPKWR